MRVYDNVLNSKFNNTVNAQHIGLQYQAINIY